MWTFYFFTIVALLTAMASVAYATQLYQTIMDKDEGDEAMRKIARAIQDGARAFLHAEYKWLGIFVGIVFLMMFANHHFGWRMAIPFLMGAVASASAGYFGMHTATRAAVRTTQAAKTSLSQALDVAFTSGTVMGLTVVGLGLAGVSLLLLWAGYENKTALDQIMAFSFGASSIALFARVGGGIYTKAADVGADLVGKVEAGIPEDDPRNPATIADNVGDNVGDVAGMGADLFESYVGAILATIVLGFAVAIGDGSDPGAPVSLMVYPLALASAGIVASIFGTFKVKTDDESRLSHALHSGLTFASIILTVFMAVLTAIIGPSYSTMVDDKVVEYSSWSIFGAMVVGLFLGVLIGKVTEYYTSEQRGPVHGIAANSETGAATNIISGLAVGMYSTAIPVILLALGIWLCNDLAGIYGICIAAVGMLSTLGISLGVDAFGPVADNAGGLAEMTHCDPEVRKRTDALDATGNTTAAIGKGFAIGSAALTALALFSAFRLQAEKMSPGFSMDLSNPEVMIGLLIGAMLPFLFSAMAMTAVGKAAKAMVDEVRRQFKEIPGIMEGTGEPDYRACVDISTKGALHQMIAPGILAVASPIAVGMTFGPAAVGGLLAGALGAGVMMALFMSNAGGAWDNAKKYIEAGNHGGKGSEPHKAAVTGDTVGDPFKDTAGPAINILVKLMSIASLLALPLFV
ncbi:MAG: sodium-translocating pyrophosphatase [Planctomycetota bacterium]|nr:sodium-translocating pyrophosphatase [Planctomycetota bacterium]